MPKLVTLAASALVAVAAATTTSTAAAQELEFADTDFDHSVPFKTYVTSDDKGHPAVYGFLLPDHDKNINLGVGRLPPTVGRFTFDVGHPEQDAVPFDHMEADYNPGGHPGGFTEAENGELLGLLQEGRISEFEARFLGQSPFLGVPHWDLHYQVPTAEEVESWTCAEGDVGPTCQPGPGNAAFMQAPPPDYTPQTHYPDLLAMVPRMGTHLEDKNLPFTKANGLFHRQPALIYGSYAGRLVFWELMVSLDALRIARDSGTPHTGEFTHPRLFDRAGYWPTRWTISHEGDYYRVEVHDLVYRCAHECEVRDCADTDASVAASGRTATLTFRSD